jgi:hypothetical protein
MKNADEKLTDTEAFLPAARPDEELGVQLMRRPPR